MWGDTVTPGYLSCLTASMRSAIRDSSRIARNTIYCLSDSFTPGTLVVVSISRDEMAKVVSLEELGQHGASAERKWIAVDGEVFDVTAFVKLHPGVSPSGRTSGTRSLSGGPVSP